MNDEKLRSLDRNLHHFGGHGYFSLRSVNVYLLFESDCRHKWLQANTFCYWVTCEVNERFITRKLLIDRRRMLGILLMPSSAIMSGIYGMRSKLFVPINA